MQEIYFYHNPGHYFVLFDGKYEEVDITSVSINCLTNKVVYEVYRPSINAAIKREIEEIYLSKEDIIKMRTDKDHAFKIDAMKKAIGPCNYYGGSNKFGGWVFENGHPKMKSFKDVTFTKNGDEDWKADTPKTYEDEADAMAWNNAIIKREDGTEETVIGWRKKLELTPEQQKLVKELRDKFDELRNSGVEIIHDDGSEKLFAVNVSQVRYEKTEGDPGDNDYFGSYYGFPIVRDLNEDGIWVNSGSVLKIMDKL